MSDEGRPAASATPSVLSSSAVMAAGTVVSRASGFVRSTLLAAALGTQLHADVFTIANTIPNMLYILLAGGVFNAVLVPQLVRAMKHDADGGDAYTNRIITLAALFLAGVTALLVIGAPLLMRLYLDPAFFTDALAEQRESVIDFARLCLPAGLLLRHVRPRRTDPELARPVRADDVGAGREQRGLRRGPRPVPRGLRRRAGRRALRRLHHRARSGSSGSAPRLGIALQLLILLPYLKSAGFTFRPRFDFRGSGLGHTFRLGFWTVAFVVVNQIAYTVVVRLASSGTAEAAVACGAAAGGLGRHRLHDLLRRVPPRDGAALDRDGVAGHRDPPSALPLAPPTTTCRRSAARSPRRPARRWR